MIAKAVKGKGFRGALEYDLTKEGGQVLDTNMAGKNPRELAAEFGEIRKLRPNLGKAVLHVSLSAAPGEKLTDEQWAAIGQRYLRGMGFKDNQFVMTRHTDTEHEHIHILVNRITHGGEVVSDGQDYKRQETIMREIERDFGLQRVAPSIEAERKAPTKGEIEGAIRTGQPSTRQQLQQLADGAAKDCPDFTTYQRRLEAVGVELVPVAQLGGAKLSGLSYRLDGVTMKGSDLGKTYTAAGIQKRGITYEQDRDFAAVRASNERETARAFGEPHRDSAAGESDERGRPGSDAGAAGPSNGGADRRDAADAGRDRPQEPGAWRGRQAAGGDIQGSSDSSGSGSGGDDSREQAASLAAVRHSSSNRDAFSSAGERIVALASTSAASAGEKSNRPAGSGGASGAGTDRSTQAVKRQVAAMGGAGPFEVGIRDAKSGKMMSRVWSGRELDESIAWLKRMNARGNDIYIRPAGDVNGPVLVDDLTQEALERMRADGFAPAATIETSPGNFQAWVKISDKPVPADVRRVAARDLANRYGGDIASADGRHYGRLAGFTNQKPKHTRNGQQPYVLAHDCSGAVARSAQQAYMDYIAPAPAPAPARALAPAPVGLVKQGQNEYRYSAADTSRADWALAMRLAEAGVPVSDIEKRLRECSPGLDVRKAGHIDDYLRRTAAKAVAAAGTGPAQEQGESESEGEGEGEGEGDVPRM